VQRFAQSPAAHAFEDIVRPILLNLHRDNPQPSRLEKADSNTETQQHMKIAIPLVAGRLSEHFGHCEQFALIEADPASKQVLNQTRVVPPPHEPGLLPRWLHQQGVQVIIAGGMGRRALDLFAQNGIAVHAGTTGATPEELAQAWLSGALGDATPTCGHGGGGGHQHGCHDDAGPAH
jgi:predicted Fe-Mo cluster-binding NifX family protein